MLEVYEGAARLCIFDNQMGLPWAHIGAGVTELNWHKADQFVQYKNKDPSDESIASE